jgi:uncharacterized membrane protein
MVMQLTEQDILEINQSIFQAEQNTSGEICVHLRKRCMQDVLSEAEQFFVNQRFDQTEQHNAVLIFIGLTSQRFAIIGDCGIHEKVKDEFWEKIRDAMIVQLKANNLKQALVNAIAEVGRQLQHYFPAQGPRQNQLDDSLTED